MKRLNDIQRVRDAEVNLIQEQSALLLQKRTHGFSGELKSSGVMVENYIKSLLTHHLPAGYNICSGFIATTDSITGNDNLIQHDIIITDARIPHIHEFGFADIAVVAAEAVCGIVEVKRTLTKASLTEAIEHLRATKVLLDDYDGGIKSKHAAPDNLAGPTLSVATSSPLYAIVGLDCCKESVTQEFFREIIVPNVFEFVDFIWAPAAAWLASFQIKRSDGHLYFPQTVSRNQGDYQPYCLFDGFDENNRGIVHGAAISRFRSWINNTSGARLDITKNSVYFGVIQSP